MPTKTIKFNDRRADVSIIKIGNEYDNNAENIKFALPARLNGATVFLYMTIDKHSDIVQLDDERIYTPKRLHTQYPGKWEAYLEAMMDGDVVWHSDVFYLSIGDLPPTGDQIDQQYPSAIEEALRAVDTLTGVGARAETLEPGNEATVRMEEDAQGNRVIVYGIPRGEPGEGGGGSITAEDDGEGNVTLIMTGLSVTDDGDGNVVIGG